MPTTDPFADVPVRVHPDPEQFADLAPHAVPSGRNPQAPNNNEQTYDVRYYVMTRGNRPARRVPTHDPAMISQAQFNYVVDLVHDRQTTLPLEEIIASAYNATRSAASKLINGLLSRPPRNQTLEREARVTQQNIRFSVKYQDVPTDRGIKRIGFLTTGELKYEERMGGEPDRYTLEVPAGYYALDTSEDDMFVNDVTFFKIWIGTRGGWKLLMFKSDDEVELQRGYQISVLKRIAKNPGDAMRFYGLHSSRCGICHRKLTKDESRARGIGPVCAERWSF